MQTITQIIGHLPRTSEQHRRLTSETLPSLSRRQKQAADEFLAHFPNVETLLRFFSPARWGYCLAHAQECATRPCITLAQVDALYGKDGTALRILRNMFIGVYSMTNAREPLNEQSSQMAAELFLAKYGQQCSLYQMMLYFGGYIVEYKASYAQYDVQDILMQFGRKFLPRWRQSLENDQPLQQASEQQPHGIEAVKVMLRNRLYDGETAEQLKCGFLYSAGLITDAMIAEAVQAIKDGII